MRRDEGDLQQPLVLEEPQASLLVRRIHHRRAAALGFLGRAHEGSQSGGGVCHGRGKEDEEEEEEMAKLSKETNNRFLTNFVVNYQVR